MLTVDKNMMTMYVEKSSLNFALSISGVLDSASIVLMGFDRSSF